MRISLHYALITFGPAGEYVSKIDHSVLGIVLGDVGRPPLPKGDFASEPLRLLVFPTAASSSVRFLASSAERGKRDAGHSPA